MDGKACPYTPTAPDKYYILVYVREPCITKPGQDAYTALGNEF